MQSERVKELKHWEVSYCGNTYLPFFYFLLFFLLGLFWDDRRAEWMSAKDFEERYGPLCM